MHTSPHCTCLFGAYPTYPEYLYSRNSAFYSRNNYYDFGKYPPYQYLGPWPKLKSCWKAKVSERPWQGARAELHKILNSDLYFLGFLIVIDIDIAIVIYFYVYIYIKSLITNIPQNPVLIVKARIFWLFVSGLGGWMLPGCSRNRAISPNDRA